MNQIEWIVDKVFYCKHCGKSQKPKLIIKVMIWLLLKIGMSKEEIVNQLREIKHH